MPRRLWPVSVWLSRGQSLVEYGLLIAAIAVCILVAAYWFGGLLHAWLSDMLTRLTAS